MLINVFFKEIKVIGIENIPKDETVIFCGNHANQYIDPCVCYPLMGVLFRRIH